MNIAIDLDDTLNDFAGHFINFYEKHFPGKFSIQKKYFCTLGMAEQLGITREQLREMFNAFHTSKYIKKIPLQQHAKGVLTALSKNHNLFVITGRMHHHTWELDEWFNAHLPEIFKERFVAKNPYGKMNDHLKTKHEICRSMNADLVIEDDPNYALPIAEEGFPVLMIKQPWNTHLQHPHILHVCGWKEIHHYINNGIKTSTAKKSN